MTIAEVLSVALMALLPRVTQDESVPIDLFGVALDAAGDRDGDGVPDLWVGDPSGPQGVRSGRAMLVSGRTGEALLEIPAPDGAQDFGWTLVAIDDADGDGVRDVAVGAWFVSTKEVPVRTRRGIMPAGKAGVFLFSGASGERLHAWLGPADREWYPGTPFDTGPALAAVNGWDGFGDLAIGWRFASGELEEEGRVDVVSGRSGRVLASWSGEAAHDRFGAALAVVPDVDGDGKPEVAASTQPKRGERFATPQGTVGERPATVRVLGSRHAELFRVTSPACSLFGSSLAALPPSGDLPATLAITQSCHRRGVHLVSAVDGERLREIHAPGIDRWEGSFKFGRRVLPFGDLDGDGVDDLFVTAPSDFPVHPAGVVSRARDAIPTLVCVEPERVTSFERWPTGLGKAACTLGDLDGDGIDDVAIGGAWAPCGESCAGSVLVCSGKDARPLRWFTREELEG